MCFSAYNSFLLTTCGRIFSWGANSETLGREILFDGERRNERFEKFGEKID